MNVVERAKKLILEPQKDWQAIDEEPATVQGLFTGYVMILAAIPAVASFIGLSIVGIGAWGSVYRVPLGAGVTHLTAVYLLSLGAVYALALVIEGVAPKFGGKRDFDQALKVAAFFPTPMWLGLGLCIIPALWIIGFLVGLYSLYLLYLGLPKLTKVSEEKGILFFLVMIIVVIIVCVAIFIAVGLTLPAKVRGF
jgi:hypothetical protein